MIKVIITMGKDGVFGAEKTSKSKIRYYSIPPIKRKKIIDTTGCGDTMLSAIVWSIINNYDFQIGLSLGNLFASLKTEQVGFFSQNQAQKILKSLLNKI